MKATALLTAPAPAAQPRSDGAAISPALERALVATLAHELWRSQGGNEVLNWLEAEILLEHALGSHARAPELRARSANAPLARANA
jgi:hypothetical protein